VRLLVHRPNAIAPGSIDDRAHIKRNESGVTDK
jgi:hypothetical protein